MNVRVHAGSHPPPRHASSQLAYLPNTGSLRIADFGLVPAFDDYRSPIDGWRLTTQGWPDVYKLRCDKVA